MDYKEHCEIPFGAYVLANNDISPQKSNKARMIDEIYLMTNDHDSHELMNAYYVKLITHRTVKTISITEAINKSVETLARCDVNKTLKFKKRHGIEIHGANYIAVV